MTEYYNTGHFENGVWIPDCNQCGACCRYLFSAWKKTDDPDDDADHANFDDLHGVKVIGHVRYVHSPCRFLGIDNRCQIHKEENRPDCCKRFGRGNYHHPVMCQFFGGRQDKELYPDDYRHTLQE